MKVLKQSKGITLTALVVTIIILIILATISIRMVVGEGELIWQANQGKLEYRAATVDEEVMAWKAEKQMAKYTDGIDPQERNDLINDQLERGLLTKEEADDAKYDGKVQIGSRTIDYGAP